MKTSLVPNGFVNTKELSLYTLTTQVLVLFDANLGAYFFLIKYHLIPPRLVRVFFVNPGRSTVSYVLSDSLNIHDHHTGLVPSYLSEVLNLFNNQRIALSF
jgi:hypothetical protein